MENKYLNNSIRLAVATSCLKTNSLPPIKYPRSVVMYKADSYINQSFEFDMDESIISPRVKVTPRADILVIGKCSDIYDFIISYLSTHEKGILSVSSIGTGYIENSVFTALSKQDYFKGFYFGKDRETFLEKTYKCLENFLSKPKAKKIYIFNDINNDVDYQEIIKRIESISEKDVNVYLTNKVDVTSNNSKVKIHFNDFTHEHLRIASEAISAVNVGKVVQIIGDNQATLTMSKLLKNKKVIVETPIENADPNKTTLLAYQNSFELLDTYLKIMKENNKTLVYVLNNNFGEVELISTFLPAEEQHQIFSLDNRVLYKAYFASNNL